MARVASLFLPHLAVERLRRSEQSSAPRPDPRVLDLPVDDDPGACSVPRGGGWRPGARWAREDDRAEVERRIAEMPTHARPPMRELGRRSEAAPHPFRTSPELHGDEATVAWKGQVRPKAPQLPPLALVAKVGRRDEVVASCAAATALGVVVGMAATHARALVADIDLRPAEPDADAALLARLALLAVRRWSPVVTVTPPDGIWLDLAGCAHLHGGEDRFAMRLVAFCARAGLSARVAVADTPGAAHALARFGGDDVSVVARGSTAAALTPLPVAALRLGTSRPTREAAHLLRLLRLRIERIDPGMGLERFVLTAVHTEPLNATPLGTTLADDSAAVDAARLIDVVVGRVGSAAVFRLAPVASHEGLEKARMLSQMGEERRIAAMEGYARGGAV